MWNSKAASNGKSAAVDLREAWPQASLTHSVGTYQYDTVTQTDVTAKY